MGLLADDTSIVFIFSRYPNWYTNTCCNSRRNEITDPARITS